MKSIWVTYFSTFLILGVLSCTEENEPDLTVEVPTSVHIESSVYYHIDLNDRSGDTFKVSMFSKNWSNENDLVELPAVVPGTYSISDFGRFIKSINAFDEELNRVDIEAVSTNRWQLADPSNTYLVEYEISETWDEIVSSNQIIRMGGTSLEDDHALLNTFGILAFSKGSRGREAFIEISAPSDWKTATSLEEFGPNLFIAENYDQLVAAPILSGNVTSFSSTNYEIHAYSKSGLISADVLNEDIGVIMTDAEQFFKTLPEEHYEYLFHFENVNAGALEHPQSSVYVLQETEITSEYSGLIRDIAAHEYFHVVTPLDVRSHVIDDFDFGEPKASQHLWLYEGVTEWAAHMMQYRNGSKSFEDLMDVLEGKIQTAELVFDNSVSLSDISSKVYESLGRQQFVNVYFKGAILALLMDIELLTLSQGSYGLRELILELDVKYDKDSPFPEEGLYDIIVEMTFPEMEDFIEQYITGTNALPYGEYFQRLGLDFDDVRFELERVENPSDSQKLMFEAWSDNL